jgi:integrase/recombinase XerC
MRGKMDLVQMIEKYQKTTSAIYTKNTNEVNAYYVKQIIEATRSLSFDDPLKLDLDSSYAYIDYFKNHGRKSNDTINKIMSYFKRVLKYNHIHTTFDEAPKLKQKTNHFQRFYHEELKMLIQYLLKMNHNKNSIVYKTAVFLMIDSGVRVGELISIKKKNINFNSDPMSIYLENTKNGKSRYVPFSDFSSSFIKELMTKHENDYLFWNLKNDTPFTKTCLRSFYRYTQKKLGIDRIHSHRFRKTFASLLVENGMNLYDLQLLLDHSRVSTTQLYVQSRQDRGLKSYKKFNNWNIN